MNEQRYTGVLTGGHVDAAGGFLRLATDKGEMTLSVPPSAWKTVVALGALIGHRVSVLIRDGQVSAVVAADQNDER